MLFILVIILSNWFEHYSTHNLAIDLARVQYLRFVQPPPSISPIVEGMVV